MNVLCLQLDTFKEEAKYDQYFAFFLIGKEIEC